jgi:uncharacterized protein with PIN domain
VHHDAPWTLRVVVHPESRDRVLAEEPVTDADLAEARSEAWLDGFLRRGLPDLPLAALRTRLRPLVAEDRCNGYELLAEAGGRSWVHDFDIESLSHVALRASRRLVREGLLAEGDAWVYGLRACRGADAAPAAHGSPPPTGLSITTTTTALRYARRELSPLLDRAQVSGTLQDGLIPVLFDAEAHERTRRYARKGAERTPAVETGALLAGELCLCPATGEAFVTVTAAIEVHDAESSEFALVPSSKTWSGVEAVLRRMSAARPALRLVGQAHGHNFGLEGGPCAACATAAECSRTTIFVSGADRAFMRTVFAGQPFALCWIAGTNARGEEVARLYGLRGGVLRPRGYHIVPDLDR